jgi:hypothetical protein
MLSTVSRESKSIMLVSARACDGVIGQRRLGVFVGHSDDDEVVARRDLLLGLESRERSAEVAVIGVVDEDERSALRSQGEFEGVQSGFMGGRGAFLLDPW